MAGHLRQHSFTGNTDHDFTGLSNNYLPKLNSSGTGITNSSIYEVNQSITAGATGGSAAHTFNLGDAQAFTINANDYSIFRMQDSNSTWFTISPTAFNEATLASNGILDIKGGGASTLYARFNESAGGIGINIQNPTARLHVVGKRADSSGESLRVANSASTSSVVINDKGQVSISTIQDSGAGPGGETLKVSSTVGDANIFINSSGGSNVYPSLLFGYASTAYSDITGTGSNLIIRANGNLEFRNRLVNSRNFLMDTSNNFLFTYDLTGTQTASSRIQVNGSTTNSSAFSFKAADSAQTIHFAVRNDGNIGIGAATTSPQDKLHISGGTIRIQTVNGTEGAGKLAVSDANGSISFSSTTALGLVGGSGTVGGTGTTNYITKWNSSTAITDSIIYDNGTSVGIGTISPSSKLHVMSTLNDGIKTESIQSGHYILASPGNNSFGPNITSSYTLELKTPSAEIRLGRTGGTGNALIYVDSSITNGLNISANAVGNPHLTILSGGNVGIGTSSPLTKLHIEGGDGLFIQSGNGFRINDVGISSYSLWPGHASNEISTNFINTSKHLLLQTTFGGNIGVGTTLPSDKLHISGGTIRINDAGSTYGAGKLAVSDANGSISFSSTTALGLGAGSVNKYTTSTSLIAGTASYITHGLGLASSTDAIVQLWNGNNLTLGAEISAVTTNQIAVTVSVSGTYKIVVMG